MTLLTYKAILTPESHKDGEEDCGRVVKQVASSSSSTSRAEVPVITELFTQGAHGKGIVLVAHFFAVNDKCTNSEYYDSEKGIYSNDIKQHIIAITSSLQNMWLAFVENRSCMFLQKHTAMHWNIKILIGNLPAENQCNTATNLIITPY